MDRAAEFLHRLYDALVDDTCAVSLTRPAIRKILEGSSASTASAPTEAAEDAPYTPETLGRLEGVQAQTIRLWIRSGRRVRGETIRLEAYPGAGGYRIAQSAYDAFRAAVRAAATRGHAATSPAPVLASDEAKAYLRELYPDAAA
jgi:hypothetical protein